jgi:hypothetical protein
VCSCRKFHFRPVNFGKKIGLERDTDTFLLSGRTGHELRPDTSHKRERSGNVSPIRKRPLPYNTTVSSANDNSNKRLASAEGGRTPRRRQHTRFAPRRNSEAAHATWRKGVSLAVAGHGQQGEMAVSAVSRYSSFPPEKYKTLLPLFHLRLLSFYSSGSPATNESSGTKLFLPLANRSTTDHLIRLPPHILIAAIETGRNRSARHANKEKQVSMIRNNDCNRRATRQTNQTGRHSSTAIIRRVDMK